MKLQIDQNLKALEGDLISLRAKLQLESAQECHIVRKAMILAMIVIVNFVVIKSAHVKR